MSSPDHISVGKTERHSMFPEEVDRCQRSTRGQGVESLQRPHLCTCRIALPSPCGLDPPIYPCQSHRYYWWYYYIIYKCLTYTICWSNPDNWVPSRSFMRRVLKNDRSPLLHESSLSKTPTWQIEYFSPPKIKFAHYQSFVNQLILGIKYRYIHYNIYKSIQWKETGRREYVL